MLNGNSEGQDDVKRTTPFYNRVCGANYFPEFAEKLSKQNINYQIKLAMEDNFIQLNQLSEEK